ncbi:TerD family protein [Thorsellia anophelis]|uniref:Tellurite resistance protein TerA n=1 Tax=Thorsellia anophelis DSM 18579 TaxID=1123402 RepID=A0A1I0EP65_9GAMM|nr:TerD family protein [Thorsellia anophelis]SET46816.1 tellurite resistance protein TerA [Thorsellia anophelis DSM 18579]
MQNLTAGGNAPVPNELLTIRILSGHPSDISAFRLYDNAKVKGDADMIFYGQKNSDDGAVRLIAEGTNTIFEINLDKIGPDVQKIAFSSTCDEGKTISQLGSLIIQVENKNNILIKSEVEMVGRTEAALILGELYKRNNEWKFRFVSQGFNGGLKPLAEFFGVDVSDDAPTPPEPIINTAPANPSTVNLNKISLTKNSPSINLSKKTDFGLIKVNLNWNQNPTQNSTGFMNKLFSGNGKIDLDLGAFIRFKDGDADIVQALGNRFGNLDRDPYVKLLADDRTGSSATGEWLHINGEKWHHIAEILIFTFIYEGVPNWSKTDAVVTLHVPNEPPIETQLTEGNDRFNMCAIARIVNQNGSMNVERIDRYFAGHKDLDNAFGWGFSWKAGSK